MQYRLQFYLCESILVRYLHQVGNAVKTNESLRQYVDLGDLSSACVTKPETCGPEGGAISLWFKLDACVGGGIITSRSSSTGFHLACGGGLE